MDDLEHEIRRLLATVTSLEQALEDVDGDEVLFDGSMGLDSVDLVAAVVAVERRYDVLFPAETDFTVAFSSINATVRSVRALRQDD